MACCGTETNFPGEEQDGRKPRAFERPVAAGAAVAPRLCRDHARHRLCRVGAAGIGADHHDQRRRAGRGRGANPGQRQHHPGVPRLSSVRRAVSDGPGDPRDFRRARMGQGHLPPSRPCRLFRGGGVAQCAARGRRESRRHARGDGDHGPGARRRGRVRSRRHRRLGGRHRQGRHGAARRHRFLLGRAADLALCRAQSQAQGGGGVVWAAGLSDQSAASRRIHPT